MCILVKKIPTARKCGEERGAPVADPLRKPGGADYEAEIVLSVGVGGQQEGRRGSWSGFIIAEGTWKEEPCRFFRLQWSHSREEIGMTALTVGSPGLSLRINGSVHTVDADPETSLLTVLRDYLDLTGSKYGCGEGQCGACTVLIDGKAQRSCITKAGAVRGKQITTIEGLAEGDKLHPVQQAFLDEAAMQCAYCTSGMIMSAVALLKKNPAPKENEIVAFMDGNVCRCGTYPRIVSAIQKAAKQIKAGGAHERAGLSRREERDAARGTQGPSTRANVALARDDNAVSVEGVVR
jgi:aerobic-type carbon monoxide dehydrogenase small subunit (CoxS/CutS family)